MLGEEEGEIPIKSSFSLLPGGLLRILRPHLDEVMLRVTRALYVWVMQESVCTANASLEEA